MAHIRLVTYNIHSCVGTDGRRDPGRIAGVLGELDADAVALQEVESWHGDPGMLPFLAEATGMSGVAGTTMLRPESTYGNALLVRESPVEVRRTDLSFRRREPRGALDATLELEGARVRMIATHLGLRPAERRHQVEALLALLEPPGSLPTVLLGDLNEWFLWGRPLRRLHRVFGPTPAPATFPSRFPLFALDRAWVRPLELLRGLRVHASPLARRASDHLPLVLTIDL